MKKKALLVLCLVLSMVSNSQNHRLYGTITDKNSGEQLMGATIHVEASNIYSISNSYGFYSLSIPKEKVKINVSYIGYQTKIIELDINSDLHRNIKLNELITSLDEVHIKAEKKTIVNSTETGTQILDLQILKNLPVSMGEVDVLKGLQLLPGIQSSHEGTTNLSIRGGSHDQNLFLLDDAPVYNPSHALGFFSTFNPDALKSVKVYKSNMPVQYGGKLSSVVDVRMKEGNNQTQKISGGIGLIASRLTIEAPIKKNKSSYMVSARYSYAGHTANGLGSAFQYLGVSSLRDFNPNNEISFYDVNAKVNLELDEKNHFYFSTYAGRDHFFYSGLDDSSSMGWGNVIGNLRWNHIYNTRLFSNTMLVYSKYDYSYILKDNALNFKWLAGMQELDVKSDFDFYVNSRYHLKFGVALESHFYTPGKLAPRNDASITKAFELPHKKALITAFYMSNEHKINERLKINYGLRYSSFFLLGEGVVNTYDTDFGVVSTKNYGKGELIQFYDGLEPRISARYLVREGSSLKTSFSRSKQYQHLISNSTVGLPTDVWLPADAHIKPQTADQFTLGYYTTSKNKMFEFSTEFYHKNMYNLIDYKDNADLFLNPNIETQVLSGNGESYGAEFLLEKKLGKLKGWMSYTYSNTEKTIEGINNGNAYPVTYNKQHNLSTTLSYQLTKRTTLSSVFKYTSGGFITIPEGTFNYYGAAFNYYSERNGYQLPAYHRMDISLTVQSRKNKYRKWQGAWSYGVYNLYDRRNVFSLFLNKGGHDGWNNLVKVDASKMYLYGMSPYVSYNFKF